MSDPSSTDSDVVRWLPIEEKLRTLENIHEPDSRQEAFAIVSESGIRPRTLNDHHLRIAEACLHPGVPERIRIQFETARNLLLYAWFVYRFITVAEFHAFATVEYALRIKTGTKRGPLRTLLKKAIEAGCINDKGFRVHAQKQESQARYREYMASIPGFIVDEPEQGDVQMYCKILADAFPQLRNDLAHGSSRIHPGGYLTLDICADLINQLFEND